MKNVRVEIKKFGGEVEVRDGIKTGDDIDLNLEYPSDNPKQISHIRVIEENEI